MKSSLLFLSCMIASSLGCQKHSQQKTHLWRKGQGELPALFSSPQFSTTDRVLLVGNEIVRYSDQKIGPATVSNGSALTIENLKGETEYAKAKINIPVEQAERFSLTEIQKLHENRFLFLNQLKRNSKWLKNYKVVAEPEVHIFQKDGHLTLSYQIDFLTNDQTSIERFWFSTNYFILDAEKVSSDFDATGWVFPLSQQEALQEILFLNLLEKPFVSSDILEVKSQAPNNASLSNAPWKFSSDDPRFDQVQAFYFLKQGLEYFSKTLDFTFPVMVQTETFVGHPEKTSAAFTYQNKIRLGAGDGRTYSSLAKDPSVVLHELTHIATHLIARLPTQKEGGSINEGICDYFAASILNNPNMGSGSYLLAPFKRNLETIAFYTEKNQGLYHDSLIVSSLLWELRKTLGVHSTDSLALRTLARLGPATHLEEFAVALKDAASNLDANQQLIVVNLLRARQWPEQ